jgi:hypothetical protein
MVLARRDGKLAIEVPLHAQSPLPERTAFGNLRLDFRSGYVRRSAAFPWRLALAAATAEHSSAYVLKVDRNGQMCFADAGPLQGGEAPDDKERFQRLERMFLQQGS